MTKATTTKSTATTANAIVASNESHVMRHFRDWLAAVRYANGKGVGDDETNRRADKIAPIERKLRATLPRSPRDLAAKTFVAVYALGLMPLPSPDFAYAHNSEPWATAIAANIFQAYPDLEEIVTGRPSGFSRGLCARLWDEPTSGGVASK